MSSVERIVDSGTGKPVRIRQDPRPCYQSLCVRLPCLAGSAVRVLTDRGGSGPWAIMGTARQAFQARRPPVLEVMSAWETGAQIVHSLGRRLERGAVDRSVAVGLDKLGRYIHAILHRLPRAEH
jgi:hypothetical protein